MEQEKTQPEKDDKNKYPPNLYKVGDSWMIDFVYRGQRYRENIGPVSRSVAKQKAESRRTAIAEGRLAVGGYIWKDGEWSKEVEKTVILDPLFEDAADKYLEWCKAHLRPRSYERGVTSSTALKAYFSGQPLSKISPFNIEAYKLDRKTGCTCPNRAKASTTPSQRCLACKHFLKGKSNATINRELAMLKAMFYKAVEWKFVSETPMKRMKFFAEGRGRTRFLTQQEAEKLLAACNEDFRDVVLMALHSGCRKSEISSLTWPNVDLNHRTFTVQLATRRTARRKPYL